MSKEIEEIRGNVRRNCLATTIQLALTGIMLIWFLAAGLGYWYANSRLPDECKSLLSQCDLTFWQSPSRVFMVIVFVGLISLVLIALVFGFGRKKSSS